MASAARSLSIAHGFAVRDATRSRSVRRVLASIPCAFSRGGASAEPRSSARPSKVSKSTLRWRSSGPKPPYQRAAGATEQLGTTPRAPLVSSCVHGREL